MTGPQADYGEGPLGWGLEGTLFQPVDATIHPDYDDPSGVYDLAVLHLDTDLPVEPVPLVASVDTANLPGSAATVVGYGGSPFEKQRGTVAIQSADETTLRYVADPAMTCSGDSGGPVLVEDGGTWRLLAITTRGDPGCTEYGEGEHVDAFRSWLETL